MRKITTSRTPYLTKTIVLIDGLEGCGKTLFSNLVSTYERVEKVSYAYNLEFYCSLFHLNKIEKDTLNSMSKMLTDLELYNIMMSRDVNFRPSDISSVFKSPNFFKYVRRLFMKGDEYIPERIQQENPVISLTVHKLLINALPIFEALGNKLKVIEIVRHPLYMLIQQTLNNEKLISSARDFTVCFNYKDSELPWYTKGWEEVFLKSNPIEKSIYYMYEIGKMMEGARNTVNKNYPNQLLTLPFEEFVLKPNRYVDQIGDLIESKSTKATDKILKSQNVPRKKIADGIPLEIYKRCGWVPSNKGLTERAELDLRRDFAVKGKVSMDALEVLDSMSIEYEKKYMSRFF